jgi:hypothetical protein
MSAIPAFASADQALFNPKSSRLDASRIATEIQLPVSTIAVAIGKKAPSVRKHPERQQPAAGTSSLVSGLGSHRGALRR